MFLKVSFVNSNFIDLISWTTLLRISLKSQNWRYILTISEKKANFEIRAKNLFTNNR